MAITKKQQRRNVARWLDDLLSGDYKQAKGTLAEYLDPQSRKKRKPDSFCCLGVYADGKGCEWTGGGSPRLRIKGVVKNLNPRDQALLREEYFLAETGLATIPRIDGEDSFMEKLAAMNDNDRSFRRIADTINRRAVRLWGPDWRDDL